MYSVLVVDNEPIIRRGLIQCMDWQALGCQVQGDAADGEEALALMEQHPVDILITDVRMPGMDGLQLTREVRSRYPDTKVILVTAYSEFEYAQEAVRQQVVDFIIKPTSEEKIRAAVLRAKEQLRSDSQVGELVKTLQVKQQDNQALEQQLFVEGLISGNRLSGLYVRTQSARLHLQLRGSRALAVQVLCADQMEEARLLHRMEDSSRFLRRVFPEDGLIVLPLGLGTFLALALDGEEKELRRRLEDFFGLIDGFAEHSVQVGVSAPVEDALRLQAAVRQAQDALFSLAYDEQAPVLFYEEVPRVTGETAKTLQGALKHVREAFRAKDMQQVEKGMRVFEQQLSQGRIPLQEVQRYARLLYNMCTGTLIDHDLLAALGTDAWPTADQFLQRVERERLPEPFMELAQEAMRLLRGDGQGREGAMQFLQGHIAQNLAGDLSLEALARLVHLSPSYLSKEFKRTMGQNLSTYISETRMERAKALMRSPELKNYEIARLVGIDDPVYFSRAFKKATGLRPSEYRGTAQ